MQIWNVPLTFLTMTVFETQVWYSTSRKLPAWIRYVTWQFMAWECSRERLCLFCLIGGAYWFNPRLCSANSLGMSVMSDGCQANTSRLFASSCTNWFWTWGEMSTLIVIGWSGYFGSMTTFTYLGLSPRIGFMPSTWCYSLLQRPPDLRLYLGSHFLL